ncbi:SgrR family transcriptional regulator [Rouxiella silvae]|uniref:SgrR family transcriptional regulator n=1 Tax=Rouxiella silvae TaxID=1646373 RepID=A0AA40X1A9_9GAMM|nr:SgrR family transcriptional regulator [Rouxiella silvae]MBF6636935.1 SgrR family transcriptional regulator [Rouxiella silvae]ORJ22262.1 SgrR family transcriptional regulator [Rouxiella silvae]
MPSRRLEQQYLRLLDFFPMQKVSTTLQELADQLHCSKRHMRNLLLQMQELQWIDWQSVAGRGHRSQLVLLRNAHQLLVAKADKLLDEGNFDEAINLLGDEKQLVTSLLRSKLGYSIRDEYQSIRVPYYRTMPNLYPGTPLRRSELHLVRQIFNGLTRINEDSGGVEQDLAHQWRQIDPLQWRFYLRPGVQFHDGRELGSLDVVASLTRCALQPLFSHIKQIYQSGSLSVVVELTQPDAQLPLLLSHPAAMILPADHASRSDFASRPIGTGPYQVSENNDWRLLLKAFDHYFGFRALLDEVEVLMWPDLATLSLTDKSASSTNAVPAQSAAWLSSSISDVDYVAGHAVNFTGKPSDLSSEMFLERGGYFLLCDSRSTHWKTIEQRRWLREKLNPNLLIQQLIEPIRQFWVPTGSLLPSWFHCMDAGISQAPHLPAKLRLAYHEQHPEYTMLANDMKTILAAEGVELEILELDYERWATGDAQADLWLGTVNFAVPEEWNVGAWMLGMPLLKNSLSGGNIPLFLEWLQQWRSQTLSSQQLVQNVVGEGWLQPLFHHWMRLKGPEQAQGIHLNNLGWFDFKTTWMEPE